MNIFNEGAYSESAARENTGHEARGALEKYLPLLLGLLAVFLAGKALKKMFWTAFGMYMALHYSGIHLFG